MSKASPTELRLWEAVTAVNGTPSGASAGFAKPRIWDDVILTVKGTATSFLAKIWVYQGGDIGTWLPMGIDPTGTGDGSLAGLINEGFSVTPTAGSTIRHTEALTGLSNFQRVYLQLVSGTVTSLDAWIRRRQEN